MAVGRLVCVTLYIVYSIYRERGVKVNNLSRHPDPLTSWDSPASRLYDVWFDVIYCLEGGGSAIGRAERRWDGGVDHHSSDP